MDKLPLLLFLANLVNTPHFFFLRSYAACDTYAYDDSTCTRAFLLCVVFGPPMVLSCLLLTLLPFFLPPLRLALYTHRCAGKVIPLVRLIAKLVMFGKLTVRVLYFARMLATRLQTKQVIKFACADGQLQTH